MLRITHIDRDTLRIEGRIVGDASEDLQRACQESRGPGTRPRLRLDGVTSVDLKGIRTLRALRDEGFELTGASNLLSDLLAD